MSDQAQIESTGQIAELQQQLRTAQARLAESYKMASLGRLLAGIIHEINTPIGSIRSNNEVVSRSLEKVSDALSQGELASNAQLDKVRGILESCRSLTAVDRIACDRISAVIRNLKTFARVNQHDLRRVNVLEHLEAMLKLTQCEFRRRIAVETQFEPLPEVECYPELLNQVFLNILINAGQAIDGEGKIVIRARQEDDCVHISFSDSGPGIPPEVLPRIFDAGFTTKAVGEGTGLGLSICKQIVVNTHGGRLEVESPAEEGATFHIRIPVEQSRAGEC
jgi:two-component system, NtrC family, sensor kinase